MRGRAPRRTGRRGRGRACSRRRGTPAASAVGGCRPGLRAAASGKRPVAIRRRPTAAGEPRTATASAIDESAAESSGAHVDHDDVVGAAASGAASPSSVRARWSRRPAAMIDHGDGHRGAPRRSMRPHASAPQPSWYAAHRSGRSPSRGRQDGGAARRASATAGRHTARPAAASAAGPHPLLVERPRLGDDDQPGPPAATASATAAQPAAVTTTSAAASRSAGCGSIDARRERRAARLDQRRLGAGDRRRCHPAAAAAPATPRRRTSSRPAHDEHGQTPAARPARRRAQARRRSG